MKKLFPASKIAASEALQCPTLLLNGYGDHRIGPRPSRRPLMAARHLTVVLLTALLLTPPAVAAGSPAPGLAGLPLRSAYWQNLSGGTALQVCIKQGGGA